MKNKPSKFKKIGIDTSVIINLIVKDIDIYNFKRKNFNESDKLYYAMRTKYEFKGVVLNRYGFDKKEKNKLWKRAKNSLELVPIKIGNRDISKQMDKVKKANTLLIEQKQNAKFPIFSKIGDADIEIISNFLKWNITEIYTSDKAFYETCKLLGLDSKFISISNYYEMERRL